MLRKIYDGLADVYVHPLGKIDERMYVVKRGGELLVFDPNICGELLPEIEEWGINGITVALTHEHYDHITGVKWLSKQRELRVICSRECKNILDKPLVSVQDYFDILIPPEEEGYYRENGLLDSESYQFRVDMAFEGNCSFLWQGLTVDCIMAPGHSMGGAIYVIEDSLVFTGDNLINGSTAITRFPGGSRKMYCRITKPVLQEMDDDKIIFPGHGGMGRMRELRVYL